MLKDCPMCGNSISVNLYPKEFRCRWCKTLLVSNPVKIKGKNKVKIEIKDNKHGEMHSLK